MRKNFGAKPWTYPQPVFIIGTYDEQGRPDAMNAAWGGIDYDDRINLCLSAGHKTVKNLLAAGNVHSPIFHCSGISAACGIYGKTVFEDGGRVEGVCVLRKLGSPAVCGYIALDVIVW